MELVIGVETPKQYKAIGQQGNATDSVMQLNLRKFQGKKQEKTSENHIVRYKFNG